MSNNPTASNTITPLPSSQKIVNPDGTPTQFFIRWAQERSIDISNGITYAQLVQILGSIEIIAGDGLTGGGAIDESVTLALAVIADVAGYYTLPHITIDEHGRVIVAADGGLEVSDGTNDFTGILKLLFSGATVSNPSPGEAKITITGGGGGGGGGGWTLLDSYTGSGTFTSATIDVSAYDELLLVGSAITKDSSTSYFAQFGDGTTIDTANHYYEDVNNSGGYAYLDNAWYQNGANNGPNYFMLHVPELSDTVSPKAMLGSRPGVYTGGPIKQIKYGVNGGNINGGKLFLFGRGGGGDGSGAFVKLGEAIASGGSTTVLTVSSIPATSKDMKIILTGAINGGSNPEIDLTFNGDNSAIYDWRWSQQFGSNSGSSDTKIYAAQLANSNFPSPGTTECTLAGYASTVFNKYMSGVANVRTGTGGNNIIPWTWEAEYLSTAAINEVTMTAAGGAPFRDGTRLTIYGMG